jgi:crotonobetainyl-CoA:carnitine CoA-transferase CaiB-like acyl-CoA transferase
MQALEDLRVIDMSTVLAGPGSARYLADFGADVVKVEAPAGDGLRDMGWRDPRDGEGLWWKFVGRGKRSVVLDLKTDDGGDQRRARRRTLAPADRADRRDHGDRRCVRGDGRVARA